MWSFGMESASGCLGLIPVCLNLHLGFGIISFCLSTQTRAILVGLYYMYNPTIASFDVFHKNWEFLTDRETVVISRRAVSHTLSMFINLFKQGQCPYFTFNNFTLFCCLRSRMTWCSGDDKQLTSMLRYSVTNLCAHVSWFIIHNQSFMTCLCLFTEFHSVNWNIRNFCLVLQLGECNIYGQAAVSCPNKKNSRT